MLLARTWYYEEFFINSLSRALSTYERLDAMREVQVANTIPPAPLKPGRCSLRDQTRVFFLQVQTSVFIFPPGSHMALWPRTKVLWPRGKTAFVQLQLRPVLRRNDWQRGHSAAESRPGRLNLVQSRLRHLVCTKTFNSFDYIDQQVLHIPATTETQHASCD